MSAPVTQAELDARVKPLEIKIEAHLDHAGSQDERLREVEDTILAWRSQMRLLTFAVAPATLWALWQIVSALASAAR